VSDEEIEELALESPTFTFTPYDGDQEEVTLK
jgi:hypothetical protein